MNILPQNAPDDNQKPRINSDLAAFLKDNPDATPEDMDIIKAKFTAHYEATSGAPKAVNNEVTQQPTINLAHQKNRDVVASFAEIEETLNESMAAGIIENLWKLADVLHYDPIESRFILEKAYELDAAHVIPAGDVTEAGLFQLQTFLQANGFPRARMQTITPAFQDIARRREISAFDQFLERATDQGKPDDGIYQRVMVEWLGAKDEPYSVAWLKWLLAAIYKAQTFRGPVDEFRVSPNNFVLQGAQGIGKSLFFDGLAAGRVYVYNGVSDLQNKDAQISMTQSVLINADDKGGQRQRDVDSLKQLVTQPLFRIRQPYEKEARLVPIRGVFVGSTNRRAIYTDTTGNRRDYPLPVAVDMTDKEANNHGSQWYQKINGDPEHKPTDKNLFLDLWATFLRDWKREPWPTVATGELESRRSELVEAAFSVSDLQLAVDEAVAQLFDGQNPEGGKMIDPFSGQPLARATDKVPVKDFNKRVTEIMRDAGQTKAVPSSRIQELMLERGFKVDRNNGRQYSKPKHAKNEH